MYDRYHIDRNCSSNYNPSKEERVKKGTDIKLPRGCPTFLLKFKLLDAGLEWHCFTHATYIITDKYYLNSIYYIYIIHAKYIFLILH